ncbi:hypothetical protein [Methylosarcina fibrata]|nr:hypothetical protein [Methylosarcina fibrata]
MLDAVEHDPGILSGLFVNYADILVGIACAIGIKLMHFKRVKTE